MAAEAEGADEMRNWNRRAARNRGFTLVELVVVMIIIAILAGAAVIQVSKKTEMARRTRALQDLKTFETALDQYAAENGDPPTTQQGLQALRTKPSTPPEPRNWNGPYVKSIPKDPWGDAYVYSYAGDGSGEYELLSYGKDGQPGGGNEFDADVTINTEE
jgi:general secretion pathway protein G